MKLIVCSVAHKMTDEQELVSTLIDANVSCFHLVKPSFTKEETRTWLNKLPIKYHRTIVLHDHWTLTNEFNLKGIHLGAKVLSGLSEEEKKNWINFSKQKNMSISSSVHNQEEINLLPEQIDYVLLSPVFESISKKEYFPQYTNEQFDSWVNYLKKEKQTKVFALGGVEAKHFEELFTRGFDGAATLGALWKNIEGIGSKNTLLNRLNELILACNTATTY